MKILFCTLNKALDAATVSSSNAYLLHKINNSLGTALRENMETIIVHALTTKSH